MCNGACEGVHPRTIAHPNGLDPVRSGVQRPPDRPCQHPGELVACLCRRQRAPSPQRPGDIPNPAAPQRRHRPLTPAQGVGPGARLTGRPAHHLHQRVVPGGSRPTHFVIPAPDHPGQRRRTGGPGPARHRRAHVGVAGHPDPVTPTIADTVPVHRRAVGVGAGQGGGDLVGQYWRRPGPHPPVPPTLGGQGVRGGCDDDDSVGPAHLTGRPLRRADPHPRWRREHVVPSGQVRGPGCLERGFGEQLGPDARHPLGPVAVQHRPARAPDVQEHPDPRPDPGEPGHDHLGIPAGHGRPVLAEDRAGVLGPGVQGADVPAGCGIGQRCGQYIGVSVNVRNR